MPVTQGLSSKDFEHLRSAIDEAAIVAITDSRGIITYVNKKFCAISKYAPGELIGKTHKVVSSGYHPPAFFAEMWRVISSGKVWEGEIRNRAKDGTLYWVHTTIVPFVASDGKPEQYVAVRYEITERVLAQEQLRIHARKLEISNRELQDFASVAAHDLQEPLRKIQSFSDRVKVKAQGTLNEEVNDYLDRILNSAQRMQTLINDLLTYSRVTTKAEPFRPVDLNQILAQVVSDLEIRLERTGGQVNWKDLPSISADPTQMRQLFQNLISNALKFHRPDIPPVVTVLGRLVAPERGGRQVCEIEVSDNGIGFDEKYLEKIFTIFQRLHAKHEYEGTGIGLAVCRKIVDRHSGTLTARSTPGNGATFVIQLPVKPGEGNERATEQ